MVLCFRLKNQSFSSMCQFPDPSEFPENSFIFDFSWLLKPIFQKTSVLTIPIKVPIKSTTLCWSILWKWYWFSSLHQNRNYPKISKSATKNVSSWFSNSCFSKTTGLLSVTEVSMKKFTLSQKHSTRKSLILIYVVQKFRKVFLVFKNLNIQTKFSRRLPASFPSSGSQSRNVHLENIFSWWSYSVCSLR